MDQILLDAHVVGAFKVACLEDILRAKLRNEEREDEEDTFSRVGNWIVNYR